MNAASTPFTAVGPVMEMHRGRIVRIATQLMRRADGGEQMFEFAERAPGVRILVVHEDAILLTREWRPETASWDYRLPGGKVFDTLPEYLAHREALAEAPDAVAIPAAQRELREEAGLELPLTSFTMLHRSVCGTTMVWDLYYYIARPKVVTERARHIMSAEGEETFTHWTSIEDVLKRCLDGTIQEDRTAAVLLRFCLRPAMPESETTVFA